MSEELKQAAQAALNACERIVDQEESPVQFGIDFRALGGSLRRALTQRPAAQAGEQWQETAAALNYYAHNGQWPTQPAAQATPEPLTGCNCRWQGETQVEWCELHLAHKEAIHEWAERAKAAEAKLKATPEPVGEQREGEFFAFDAEGGHAFYKTQQEAIGHAALSLKYYRDGAADHNEWDEDVEQIRWGVVMQRANAANVETNDEGESHCDYELQNVATRPAPGVPAINYYELIRAAFAKNRNWAQGTNGCVAFAKGAEWFRDLALAAAQAKGGQA